MARKYSTSHFIHLCTRRMWGERARREWAPGAQRLIPCTVPSFWIIYRSGWRSICTRHEARRMCTRIPGTGFMDVRRLVASYARARARACAFAIIYAAPAGRVSSNMRCVRGMCGWSASKTTTTRYSTSLWWRQCDRPMFVWMDMRGMEVRMCTVYVCP